MQTIRPKPLWDNRRAAWTYALFVTLAAVCPTFVLAADQNQSTVEPALPALSNEEAWRLLPPPVEGAGEPLPTWARMFVSVAPRATAALLEFDRIHRTRSPLDPKLRARLRWTMANANRCDYTRAAAESDMRRAGADEREIEAMRRDAQEGLPPAERAAVHFCEKMTRRAASVADEEFAAVLGAFGEKKTVAMVQMIAAANFQDRLFLTLGVPSEAEGPLPPSQAKFDPLLSEEKLPKAPERKKLEPVDTPTLVFSPPKEWTKRGFQGAFALKELQKAKAGRIAVPTSDFVKEQMKPFRRRPNPQRDNSDRPIEVLWTLVCNGYSPEFSVAWSDVQREFGADAKMDRMLTGSMFWVATNSVDCFY